MRVILPVIPKRYYSKKFSFKNKSKTAPIKQSVHPTKPARTRFAPSPTGYLHLGSLRTALYNYLLAKNTGGQFLLRLEDTDQKRLVQDAENNIYDSLAWCNLKIDEGPNEGGKFGPYRQSDRMEVYKKYAKILIDKGYAYYCGCSKERLNDLRETASKLNPPTTVTYDRKCFHEKTYDEKSIIRFKSPDIYEPFNDLLHGNLNLQPQYNNNDRRYDDFVIMKSDGLPTYHFANVVDDHLMQITHVIRGEEWLPSTPKHIALYRAFEWVPPSYTHIPLLTSLEDKKLSKRSGDIGILSMKEKGILPEALVNFVALFGWSPPRINPGVSTNESMSLEQIVEKFSLDDLTKGNAKVNDSKLYFFNKYHLNEKIKDPKKLDHLIKDYYPKFNTLTNGKYSKEDLRKILTTLGPSLTTLNEIETVHSYLFEINSSSKAPQNSLQILSRLIELPPGSFNSNVEIILKEFPTLTKKNVFQSVRNALSGGKPGLTIPLLIELIGEEEYKRRIKTCIELCTN